MQGNIKIELRAYGPELSPEERQVLLNRVYLLDPNLVMWRELPVLSVFHIELFGQKVGELTAGLTSFSVIVDLTEAERPNAEIRDCLRRLFNSYPNLDYIAVFTGENWISNLVAKFVLSGSLGTAKFSVHKSQAEALEAIRTKRGPQDEVGIMKYIVEINAGKCSITDELIAKQSNRETQEILRANYPTPKEQSLRPCRLDSVSIVL